MARSIFKIAQKRKVKLSRLLIKAWRESDLRPFGEESNDVLRRAFSSIHTTDEIRNAVLNAIFNPDFNYRIELETDSLGLTVKRNEKGHVYLAWYSGHDTWTPTESLHKQILQSSYIRHPFSKTIRSISQLFTPEQTSKALNGSVWVSGYLGVVSNLAWLIRAFARQHDIADILWAYRPKEDETQGYLDELSDDTSMLFDKEALAQQLETVLKDLKGYDEFINSLEVEEGMTSSHTKLKEDLTKLISIAKMENEEIKDFSLINKYREDKWIAGLIEKNEEKLDPIYNFIFSALSVVDTSMEAGEAMTKIDITDHDIMDKIMKIHGNKLPPKHQSGNIFREPVAHIHGANEYFHERDVWRRQHLLKDD